MIPYDPSLMLTWYNIDQGIQLNDIQRNSSFLSDNHNNTIHLNVVPWNLVSSKFENKRPQAPFYFGAQNDLDIGPLRPIFITLLKVAQIDMLTKTESKRVKNDQMPELLLILRPKVAKKIGLWGPYSPHSLK